jgi:DNA-binding NtrC family response regulator
MGAVVTDERIEQKTAMLSAEAPRLELVVLDQRGTHAHALAPGVELVIGRAEDADVRIDERSISRRHAVIRVGQTVQLEDLGSSNGTQVRGRRLQAGERADLEPGELFEVGNTLCALRGPSATERPRRLHTHDYFEARLDDECALAARRSRPFAVVRVSAPAARATDLLAGLRPGDVAATYGAGEYELLLLECPADEAAATVEALRARLAPPCAALRLGLASYPRDGRSGDALLACACAALVAAVEPTLPPGGSGPVVVDERMQQLHRLVEKVGRSEINVLLLGETGAGKEVFAERLHASSPRAERPLLRINCAGFSESLLESELFGHERGAFTGAAQSKPGLLESAQGGSVFLDEVGELPVPLQAKLLRVLEERALRRVGGVKVITLDVRFIAATNRDLELEVAQGRFRADLFFRLNGISLLVPPLRERVAEIEPLARRFAAQAARAYGRADADLDGPALAALRSYPWPGNVRELKNMMERAVLLSGGERVGLVHLPLEKLRATVSGAAAPPASLPPSLPPSLPVEAAPTGAAPGEQRQRILAALEQSGGNQSRAAELLGVSRRTFGVWMDRHGLKRPRKRGQTDAGEDDPA